MLGVGICLYKHKQVQAIAISVTEKIIFYWNVESKQTFGGFYKLDESESRCLVIQ